MATTEKTMSVKGMHCNGCANSVRVVLEEDVEGVQSARVDLAGEAVTVVYDPDVASLDAMAKAVDEAGYKLLVPQS